MLHIKYMEMHNSLLHNMRNTTFSSRRRQQARRQLQRRNMWSSSPHLRLRWAPQPRILATTCSVLWQAAKPRPTSSCPPSVCPRCWRSYPWVTTQTHWKLNPNCFGFDCHGVYGPVSQTGWNLFQFCLLLPKNTIIRWSTMSFSIHAYFSSV